MFEHALTAEIVAERVWYHVPRKEELLRLDAQLYRVTNVVWLDERIVLYVLEVSGEL